MSRLPFSVPAWLMFSTSSALISRRQLIEASLKAGASNISRVYQQNGSPAGGPPTFGFVIAVTQGEAIARKHRVWYQDDCHAIRHRPRLRRRAHRGRSL